MNIKKEIERIERTIRELEYYYDSDMTSFEYEAGPYKDRLKELKTILEKGGEINDN